MPHTPEQVTSLRGTLISDGRILRVAGLGVLAATIIFYFSASLILGISGLFIAFWHALALAILILMGYEGYFRAQRAIRKRRPVKVISVRADDLISFAPRWVWVYGVLYYFLIFFPAGLLVESKRYELFVLGGACLWPLSLPICLVAPTVCPPQWRLYSPVDRSTRLLALIQQLDDGVCCLPSLHAAYSAYASTFYPKHFALIAVPLVVCVSCLFVKQHSIVDLPLGLAIGYAVGYLVNLHM